MDNSRRFIEESFPVKEVSITSALEKNIRHGHISSLHVWWARRPLSSSRATNYAALISASKDVDEWNTTRQFIIDFSKWENSNNPIMIKKAREDILRLNSGKPPRVLDPFSGGGAIPLEAFRLGCETYASDYNPVSNLLLKCTLEYPFKYGKATNIKTDDWTASEKTINLLVEDVKRMGEWVLQEAKKELVDYYPSDDDGGIPIGYIWARTIPCQNPTCGIEIPLMRKYWLVRKADKQIYLKPYVSENKIEFTIVGSDYEQASPGFDPEMGTISRAIVTCPACGSVCDDKTTKSLFRQKKAGQRMVAVVTHNPKNVGKRYRCANAQDIETYYAAEEYLKVKLASLVEDWGISPVPDEALPPQNSHRAVGSQLPIYGFTSWSELFNSRQSLTLITFTEKIRAAYPKMLAECKDSEYSRAVISYLALTLDRMAMSYNTLTAWQAGYEKMGNMFSRQALAMVWDYAEPNAVGGAVRSWESLFIDTLEVIANLSSIPSTHIPKVEQSSATSLNYPSDYFEAVFTDPPYYDNVPYSYLSDFFYVWLKRSVGSLYPELFSTPLTPKKDEIVVYGNRPGGKEDAKIFFEDMLKNSFREISRVLKKNGIATIVYAHKSTSGWETLINSLLDSGLIVTGAWPLNTERNTRINADETASLSSSIYIVARKISRLPTGFYINVQEELKQHLNKKLDRLWQEGVSGADFFIAAIGSAIEVFGKYEKVMDYEGEIVRAGRLLEDVRHIATDYAVRQILHNGFAGEISDLSRFYVLYRWNYGEAKVDFDEARKLAQSCNIDLAKEWNRGGFIKKDKEFIKMLGPQDRQLEDLKNSNDLIDILHTTLLLWEKGKRDDIVKLLHKSGYGKSEAFYRVAQAVSETLPVESKEKKLLDGFLAGKERLREEVRKETTQGRLL